MFPLAVGVTAASGDEGPRAPRALRWLPLDAVVARRAELPDGHLRVTSLRVAHALGVIG